jgi:excisionase family DNA binding protein
MTTTFERRHVSEVAEIVDPDELESRAGEPLTGVFISYSDGTQVAVSERGRELIEFILAALHSGREINVEAEEELLTPGVAAEVLGVARQSVYRWQDAGLLPVVMRGRSRAVPATAVRELKTVRDSRTLRDVADSLAGAAADPVTSDDGAAGLFASVQEAVRSGGSAQAGQLWRAARVAQVAQQAQHARDVFASDLDD